MSEPPPLPESDEDPYALLDVPRGSDAAEIRRAYARRIKVYRPERHPEAFRRLHEAYRTAMAYAELEAQIPDDGTDAEPAPHDVADAAPLAHLSETWRIASEGDQALAGARMEEAGERWAGDGAVVAHRFLWAEAQGVPFSKSVGLWRDALLRDAHVGPWLWTLLSGRERRRLARQPGLGWRELRRLRDRTTTFALFQLRCHARLLDGDYAAALGEVRDPTVLSDIVDTPFLDEVAREVLAAVVWEMPDEARALHARLGETDATSIEITAEDHYRSATDLVSAYRAWMPHATGLPALARYVRIEAVLDAETWTQLALDVHAEFCADMDAFLGALEKMDEASPALLNRYVRSIAVRDDEPDEAGEDEATVVHALRAADALAEKAPGNRRFEILTGLLILGALFSFAFIRWYALLLGVVGFVLLLFLWPRVQRSVYRRSLRAPLLRLSIERGISPFALVAFLQRRPKPKGVSEIGNYEGLIASDRLLRATYATTRLAYLSRAAEERAPEPTSLADAART
jgi:hypothetical protein